MPLCAARCAELLEHDLVAVRVQTVEDARPSDVLRFERHRQPLSPPECVRRFEVSGWYDEHEAESRRSEFGLALAFGVVIAVLVNVREDEPGVTEGQVAQVRLFRLRKVSEAEP